MVENEKREEFQNPNRDIPVNRGRRVGGGERRNYWSSKFNIYGLGIKKERSEDG